MNDQRWWQDRYDHDHEHDIGLRDILTSPRYLFEIFLRIVPFSFFFIAGFAAPEASMIRRFAEQAPTDPQYLRWVIYEAALFAIPLWYYCLLRRARARATDTPGSRADRLVLALFLIIGGLLALLLGVIVPPGTRLEF
ncbi:MAG: hypothetical protein AB1744_09830 [Candidatus Zixiibacteriota bacterium]